MRVISHLFINSHTQSSSFDTFIYEEIEKKKKKTSFEFLIVCSRVKPKLAAWIHPVYHSHCSSFIRSILEIGVKHQCYAIVPKLENILKFPLIPELCKLLITETWIMQVTKFAEPQSVPQWQRWRRRRCSLAAEKHAAAASTAAESESAEEEPATATGEKIGPSSHSPSPFLGCFISDTCSAGNHRVSLKMKNYSIPFLLLNKYDSYDWK